MGIGLRNDIGHLDVIETGEKTRRDVRLQSTAGENLPRIALEIGLYREQRLQLVRGARLIFCLAVAFHVYWDSSGSRIWG
jgi:hypothetical protein